VKWGSFFAVTIVIIGILLLQWPKMKQAPKKDKWAFGLLLLIGWALSMFDLQHISGPITWKEVIFRPFRPLVEK